LKNFERSRESASASHLDRLPQFSQFCRRGLIQGRESRLLLQVAGHQLPQFRVAPDNAGKRYAVAREIAVLPCQQVAALACFRILDRTTQRFDRCQNLVGVLGKMSGLAVSPPIVVGSKPNAER
jgi:hypothetical protein